MSNYYRRFIADYSKTTAALSELLKSQTKSVRWTPAAEEAFQAIKEKLITAPILSSPDFDQEFLIHTDASDHAIAGVLTQKINDQERVIEYFSKKLTAQERAYHATEKEGLAALLSIEHFRGYVEGSHFVLVTDSSALTYIMRTKWKTSSRLSRWSLSLQMYDMTIVHRRGKDNVVPDALSRSVMAISAQTPSSWYMDLKLSVENRPDDYPDFRVSQGQLMKYVFNNDLTDHRYDWKIIPSPEARKEIIKACHDEFMHIGAEKTLEKVRRQYYWPKMASQIRNHVRKCTVCAEIKPPNTSTTPPMGDMRVPSRPWQIIALDYIGPLPKSKSGNQYVLVTMDLFSKWVQLHAFPKINSKTLCVELTRHWFYRNAVPAIVLTDNATTFTSKEFNLLLDRFKVKHWLTSRYHSQANPVERVNRGINTSLRSYARDNQREWDTRLSEVEVVINSTTHSSTGFTPFRIAKGEEAVLNGTDHDYFENDDELSIEARLARIREESPKLFAVVRKNLEKAHIAAARIYNMRTRQPAKPFSVGDTVYRRNTKLSNAQEYYNAKLGAQYLPCTVLAKHGSSSYELANADGRNIGVWPANLLKRAPS